MKRKVMAFIVCAFLLLAALCGCARTAELPQLEPDAQRDFMRASLVYDAGTRTLRGTQTLTATNRTDAPLTEAVLRLYANGVSEGGVTVTSVTADGQAVSYEQDAEDSTVLRVALDWQPGQTVALSWTLMLTHPKAAGAAIVTLPALAMLEDGAWRTDAYDALAGQSYAQAFDYVLELDGERYAQMQGARDVSLALLPEGKRRQRQVGGVQVTALGASASQAGSLLARAQEALSDLDKLGLSYPFASLTVAASSDVPQDGAALSGLIALDAQADKEQLRRRITRLIARQTFGILVESDPWNAPWLSQSVASAAEMLCYRQRAGEEAYETRLVEEVEIASRVTRPYGVNVGAGTAFFDSDAEMTQVLRDQGAAMLLGIERAVGEEAFLAALRLYAQQNAGQTAARAALEAALQESTGSDWSGYLADELSF